MAEKRTYLQKHQTREEMLAQIRLCYQDWMLEGYAEELVFLTLQKRVMPLINGFYWRRSADAQRRLAWAWNAFQQSRLTELASIPRKPEALDSEDVETLRRLGGVPAAAPGTEHSDSTFEEFLKPDLRTEAEPTKRPDSTKDESSDSAFEDFLRGGDESHYGERR